jgi:hypothetical protein
MGHYISSIAIWPSRKAIALHVRGLVHVRVSADPAFALALTCTLAAPLQSPAPCMYERPAACSASFKLQVASCNNAQRSTHNARRKLQETRDASCELCIYAPCLMPVCRLPSAGGIGGIVSCMLYTYYVRLHVYS